MSENKFSIENFVEDSVPSIEENDRNFRSISDAIDKRISSAVGGKSSIIKGRVAAKLSRIRSSIDLDLESLKGVDFGTGAFGVAQKSTPTGELSGKEDNALGALSADGTAENDALDGVNDSFTDDDILLCDEEEDEVVWTGSVLDRLRNRGYIDVAEESHSFFAIEPDVEVLSKMQAAKVESRFRQSEREEEASASLSDVVPVCESFAANSAEEERKKAEGRRNLKELRAKKQAERDSRATENMSKQAANTTNSSRVVGYEKLSVIPKRKYQYPTVDLIRPESVDFLRGAKNPIEFEEETRYKAEKLVETLKSFGIGITITGVTRGPSVTRFEFQPEIGVRISKIVALTDDIALNLAASAVRMEAPIPGKSAIGIEIPNETIDTVYLYDVINSPEYRNAKSKISFALGKDIEGSIVVTDLAKMPHVLIAGSTGSGKSVCINTIISGILYGASPDEVKFIMIDPKVVELGMYNNIPHLLIPVVTEPKKAASALAWAVGEVERRYHLFADHNVRDIFSFNKAVKERPEMVDLETMPQIVIIIDELADLMMVASQDVEKSIIRLAQKARAAGVHLVIATQRPSVDVITGLIKANIPSRIAFAVASSFDSRTILDTIGAEKLLGRGDMLYHPIGVAKSRRVQGAFISEAEVERVTEFVKNSYGAPQFDEAIRESIDRAAEEMQKGAGGKNIKNDAGAENVPDGDEELMMVAAELGLKQKQLSASNLQRKLKLGYSRAARIIDKLEEVGFLSSSDGSKPRQVLMTEAEWIEFNTPYDDTDEEFDDEAKDYED